jgi:mono/diheme cytochrome c family protein
MGLTGVIVLGNPSAVAQADPDPVLFAELMEEGQKVFLDNCAFCHGADGQGAGAPKLAGNGYITANATTVTIILDGYGSHGMPAFRTALTVREVAAVSTFIRNSWGNEYGMTTEAIVMQYYNDGAGSL